MKFVFNIIIISCVVLFNTNIHSESGLITDDNIAEITEINPTLLFSKKNQKEFIRSSLNNGSEEAFKGLTSWRRELIKEPLDKILLNY